MQNPLSAEQVALQDGLRKLVADRSPMERVRRVIEDRPPFDDALWDQLAELGYLGMVVPEGYGGAGASGRESMVLFEEIGRVLACVPALGALAHSATLIAELPNDDLRRELLPQISNGTLRAAVLQLEVGGFEPLNGDKVRISGTAPLVLDGTGADVFLVIIPGDDTAETRDVVVVDGDGQDLSPAPRRSMDLTRDLASVDLRDVDGRLVSEDRAGVARAVRRAEQVARTALASESIGGAERSLEISLEHLRVREQFGRPIGSFQALRHRCADIKVSIETAKAGVRLAARQLDRDAGAGPDHAVIAQLTAGEAFTHAAKEMLQLHGGMGFSWEHDAHLFLKRATTNARLFGDADALRERIARRILGDDSTGRTG